MTGDERLKVFLDSLDPGLTPALEELEEKALEENIPVIRREMQRFIQVLLAMKRPERILEVGTAVGFSALLFATYAPEAHVTTIENHPGRIAQSRENFRKYGREGQITLLEGEAGEILPSLEGPFDLIFMDAAKGQYLSWLSDVLNLMAPGSILLSDNVLLEGEILESRTLVRRRNRTIHKRMRDYLYELMHHPLLESCVLPVGDGAALSVMIPGERKIS